MKNTTSRNLLSLTLGRCYLPGDDLPTADVIATLPDWDAVRSAVDRGEIAAVVSPESGASVDPVSPARVTLPDQREEITPAPRRKGRRKRNDA